MKNFVLIALCLFGSATALQAQTANPAAGGDATGSGGSVSYSVGQITYNTYGNDQTLSEGVQQPYEISILHVGLDEAKGISLAYSVYPNPTSGILKLKVENILTKDFWYRLYDIDSKLLQSSKIDASEMDIPIENLVPATYLLKIIYKQKEVKTFKIIKTR
jgi:opacity protein-like surface antigen